MDEKSIESFDEKEEYISTPASKRQIEQLFTDPEFNDMKRIFCRSVIMGLKFRKAPGCARKLIQEIEASVAQGLDDSKIYNKLHSLVHKKLLLSKEYIQSKSKDNFSRENNRVQELRPILQKFINSHPIESYLDVGCNEGGITSAIGELLKAKSIKGCDVFRAKEEYDFEFTLLDPEDPYKLPYVDKSQDVVTAFMSLHHIEQLDSTLDEIKRVLKDDGIFLIREHDCQPPELSLLLDLLHGFYAMVWSDPQEMDDFSVHFAEYRSRDALTDIIEDEDRFVRVFKGEVKGAWRYYYDIFVKGDSNKEFQRKMREQFSNNERLRKPFKSSWRKK